MIYPNKIEIVFLYLYIVYKTPMPCGSKLNVKELRVAVKAKQPNLAVSKMNKPELLDFYEGRRSKAPAIPHIDAKKTEKYTRRSLKAIAKKAAPPIPALPYELDKNAQKKYRTAVNKHRSMSDKLREYKTNIPKEGKQFNKKFGELGWGGGFGLYHLMEGATNYIRNNMPLLKKAVKGLPQEKKDELVDPVKKLASEVKELVNKYKLRDGDLRVFLKENRDSGYHHDF